MLSHLRPARDKSMEIPGFGDLTLRGASQKPLSNTELLEIPPSYHVLVSALFLPARGFGCL